MKPNIAMIPEALLASRSIQIFAPVLVALLATPVLFAANGNDTWVGLGVDSNWGTAGNWTGANTPPVAGDSLFFDGIFGTSAANNIVANTAFNGVTFNPTAGAFTLSGNAINLNGGITNNALFAQAMSLNLALQATESVNVGSGVDGALSISGIVSGSTFGLTQIGGGLLTLGGANTFTGPVAVNGGTLSISSDTATVGSPAQLGAGPSLATAGSIILNGGALRATTATTINPFRGIALGSATGGSGTFDAGSAISSVASIYDGIMANNGGTDSFVKTGLGQLTLGGANAYSGTTTINQGTLKLDFTQAGAPAANIISSSSALVMGGASTSLGNASAPMATTAAPGATLNVTGNGSVAVSQTFNGLTLSNGLSFVTTAQTSAKNVLLALGAINQTNGGAVSFTLGGTFSSGVNAITTTSLNANGTTGAANGILGGWAVYGGTAPSGYASVDASGNIVAYTGYTNISVNTAAIISNPTNNVKINNTAVATTSLAGSPATVTINTLMLNANVNSTVNMASGDMLQLGANGGLLTANWGLTIGQTVGQGTLTAGGAPNTPGTINILNDSVNGGMQINSVVTDNGTGPVGLVVAPTSVGNDTAFGGNKTAAILTAANTYSGGTILDGGITYAGSVSAFGTGPVTVENGAQAQLGASGTYANPFYLSGAGYGSAGTAAALRIFAAGTTLTNTIKLLNDATIGAATTVNNVISGPITGQYNLTLGDGAGMLTLMGTNTYTGNTAVNTGIVEFGAESSLYNGNTANWTGAKLRVASGGTLAFALGASPYFTPTDLTTLIGLSSSSTAGFESGSSLGLDTTHAAGGTYTYSGVITNAYSGSSMGVVKLGTGTLVLSAANGYSGTTVVNGGSVNYSGLLGIAPATAAGQLIVDNFGSNAVFSVSSPASIRFNNNNGLIGNNASNAGAFYQTGGAITGINQFQLGAVTGGSYGYYSLSGGTNSITEFDLAGFNGAALGVCDISSGVLNVSAWFVPSRGTAAIAILNLTGGAFNYAGPAGQFEANWNASVGSAVINVANASLIAPNANVNMMQTGVAGKLGEINLLAGGLFQANSIAPGSATGTSLVNFNGGALQANATTATFLTANNTAANVYGGGGTINNNGVNITIPIALQAPAGSGLNTSISMTSGGSGYIGAPTVTFSGGGGVGASGYATISGGAVTGIVLTSPGINYSSAPTIALAGGGGSGAVAGTIAAPTAGTSGGMTFTGSGTTTLSAANTYTGTTTVSNGTVVVSGSLTGGATVAGGILSVSGTVSGAVTVNGGALTLNGGNVASAVTVNPGGAITPSTGTFGGLVTLAAGNSAINLMDGIASTTAFANGFALNNGNQLSFDLGSSADQISVSGGSFTHSGTVTINLNAVSGISTTTYTLITDAANDINSTTGFVVGAVPSGYNAVLGNSGGALTVTLTQSAPSVAFWKGNLGNIWNTVSGGVANWTSDSGGSVNTGVPPGTPTAVTFAATGAANFNTQLGANFTINNLTLSTANNVTIGSPTNSLTIVSGILNASTALNNLISVSNVVLGGSQTFENDSANALTISSLISGSSSALTTAGAGTIILTSTNNNYSGGTTISTGTLQLGDRTANNGSVAGGITNNSVLVFANPTNQTFSGNISGPGTVGKTGGGMLILPIANSYTGGTVISNGILQLNNTTAAGATTGTITDNGAMNLNIGGNSFTYPVAGGGTINVLETANAETRFNGNMSGFTGAIYVPASSGSSKTDIEGLAAWNSAATIIVTNGGTLFVESALGGTSSELVAATIYVSGNGNSEGFGALRVDDSAIITGNVILQGNTVYGGAFTGPYGISGVSGVIDDLGLSYGINCANTLGGQSEEFWGANTYHGATTWTNAAYTLVLGNGSALQNSTLNIGPGQLQFDSIVSSNAYLFGGLTGTANISLANNGSAPITLIVGNNNTTTTYSGSLSDSGLGGSLTKVGSGTLTLAGVNTFGGTTTVSGGKLIMTTLQTNVTSGITVNDGTTLTLNVSGTNQLAPTAYALGSSTGAVNEFVGLNSTLFAPVNAGSLTLNGLTTVNIIGGSFVIGNKYPLISFGSIGGSGGFALGTLPHGLTANIVTNGGNTIALNVTAYTPVTDVWTGSVNTNWNIGTTANWLIGGVAGTYADGDNTRFDDTAATTSVFVTTIVSPNSTIVSNVLTSYTFNGSAINGAGGLTKQGSGLLVLNQTNTYNGNTVISNGTVRIGGVNTIPGGAGKGDVLLAGTLDLNGNNELINGLSGGGIVDTVAGGTPILSIGSSGSSSTFSGLIQNTAGTLTMTKNGSGTLTLGGNNTYSGGTTVNAGTLKIASSTALGAGATTVATNATLDLNGQSIAENITLNSGANLVNNSVSAAAVSGNTIAANGSFTVIGGIGNITFATITHASGAAQFDVTNLNTGTIDLAGTVDNGFLNMHVAAGTVILDKTGAVGQRATSALFVEGGTAQIGGSTGDQIFDGNTVTVNSGTLDMNGRTETVGALAGSGGLVLNNAVSTTATLTIGGGATPVTGIYSGTITNGAGIMALTKIGTGFAYLSGINPYTGNTLISGGTLFLEDSIIAGVPTIGGSALITVASGATLDVSARSDGTLTLNNGQTLTGNGSVNGNVVTLAGSTINPGGVGAVGTLAVGSATLGGNLIMELNRTNTPANCDQLTGSITYGGTLSVTNIGQTLQVGDTFQLFPSAATGFAGISLPTTDATGYHYTWNNSITVSGSISVATVTSPVNTSPTNITATVSGHTLTLSWPADHLGWHLQVQTNSLSTGLGTNWFTIPGSDGLASTNITIVPANGTVFYRMVYP